MARLTHLTLRDYGRLVWPFGALILGGILLGHLYPSHWWLRTVTDKIADALMVAGFIGAVVELSSLNRLIDYVGQDVARRVTAAHLPSELRGKAWDVTNSNLVIENYERRYRITRDGVSAGYLKIESTLTYTVRNYGFSDVEYAPMLAEEEFHKPQFIRVEYKLTSGPEHAYTGSQIDRYTTVREQTRARAVDKLPKVTLRSQSKAPAEVCSVRWEYWTEMPDDYADITAFGNATIGFVVELEGKPPDLDFYSTGEEVQHHEGSARWYFKGPFIRGQHVRVWWRKL